MITTYRASNKFEQLYLGYLNSFLFVNSEINFIKSNLNDWITYIFHGLMFLGIRKRQYMQSNFQTINVDELRNKWAKAWGKKPHGTMGRKMMINSLVYKDWETKTGGVSVENQKRIDQFVSQYKSSPEKFDISRHLKPGTRLVRTWKGKKYLVTVINNGFEFDGKNYNSLSKIANDITGSRWNGWVFFGIKK